MAVQIRKATRKKARLRLGMAAPTGAGKTMGALLLAYGLTGDWGKVCIIDTEFGSGELYVGETVMTPDGPITIGEYDYINIEPEFTVPKYIEAIWAAEQADAECIIVDSLSHAWTGKGGLLDKQGKIADKSGNSYTAWRTITPEHNSLVDKLLQSPAHIICTMRSKTEYVLETNEKGRQVPRKVGMAPVQRDGLEYEFTVFLDIDQNHNATATKDRTNRLNGKIFQISPSIGKILLDWLNSGVDEYTELKNTIAKVRTADALVEAKEKAKALWPSLSKIQRDELSTAVDAADKKVNASAKKSASEAADG